MNKSLGYLLLVLTSNLIIESESNERMRSVIHHSPTPNRDRRNEEHHLGEVHHSSGRDGRDVNDNNILLQRIFDKLTTIQSIDEQKLQRLATMEQKLSKIESNSLEFENSIRTELQDVLNKLTNLEWMPIKIEGEFEKLRNEIQELRNGAGVGSSMAGTDTRNGNNSHDIDEKLTSLAVFITSTRSAVHRIEREILSVGQNMSNLLSANRELTQLQRNLPSKQFLNNALGGIKGQPVYAMMQNGQASRNALMGSADGITTPSSCSQLKSKRSGANRIKVEGSVLGSFFVYCDMETQDGGWTVIQSRKDGVVNFYRNWLEYKNGFGNLDGEFWIGLDKLHEITNSKLHELYILLEDHDHITKYARYATFAIGSEKEGYPLTLLGAFSGTAGDSLSYHGGSKFSTFDVDNDGWPEGNCAQAHVGAWWYNACDMCNLNGRYLGDDVVQEQAYHGIYWDQFHGNTYSLARVKMLIRPIE